MEKCAVFIDIDGTLLNTHHEISKDTRITLKLLRENGHKLYICSGRPLCDIDDYILELNFDGIVAAGGAYVISKGIVYRNIQFNTKEVERVEEVLNEARAGICYEMEDGVFATALFKKILVDNIKVFSKSYVEKVQLNDKKILNTGKITFICEKEQFDKIKEKLNKDYEVIKAPYMDHTNNYVFAEICLKGITKEDGIKSLGLSEKIIAIGDSDNDIDMIKYADIGIAMGNASAKCKDVADIITSHVDEEGFFKAFKKIKMI